MRYMKFFILALFVFSMVSMSEAALPKKGSIAVIAQNNQEVDSTTTDFVTNVIINRLLGNGYKIVDRKALERIRRDKATVLALEGNVEAIMKLSSQYGYSTLLTVQVGEIQSWRDDFGFYGAIASIMAKAMASNGSIIYADEAESKEVGHRKTEVIQSAVRAASQLAADRMIEVK